MLVRISSKEKHTNKLLLAQYRLRVFQYAINISVNLFIIAYFRILCLPQIKIYRKDFMKYV